MFHFAQPVLQQLGERLKDAASVLRGTSTLMFTEGASGRARLSLAGLLCLTGFLMFGTMAEAQTPREALLRASNADAEDQFGYSVSIDGDYAIVGARGENGPSGSKSRAGAAYVFERSGGSWQEVQVLRASNADANDRFGKSVAIGGERVIVGAPEEDGPSDGKTNVGAAYIFERTESGWSQTETKVLRHSDTNAFDEFGYSVAIDGDRAIVGARFENGPSNGKSNAGAAYIFERTGSGWSKNEDQVLRASNAEGGDRLGVSVAIDGDYAIVGARFEDGPSDGKNKAGTAYVFERSGGTWGQAAGDFQTETEALRASNANEGDRFGTSTAVNGDRAILGAPGEDGPSENETDGGAAYVFERSGGTWGQASGGFQTETDVLRASNAGLSDVFGSSVSIGEDRAIIGASGEDGPSNNKDFAGAAYVFERSGGTWGQASGDFQTETKILRASNADGGDNFGRAVAINGDRALVGANEEDGSSNSNSNAGAAYIKTVPLDPVFTAVGGASLTVSEDDSPVSVNSQLAVTDFSLDQTLTWSVENDPSHGMLSGIPATASSGSAGITPSGITYEPDANYGGADSFTIQVSDGSATDMVTVNVTVREAPAVASVDLTSPGSPTNQNSVTYTVTFSESVSGADDSDFTATQVSGTTSGTVAGVSSSSGTAIDVTVESITGNGDLRLDIEDDDSITNGDGVPLGGVGTSGAGDGSTEGTLVTIDNTAPAFSAGSSNSVSISESVTHSNFLDVDAGDDGTPGTEVSNYALSSAAGSDADGFSIESNTGQLSLTSPKDFESPGDADGNNDYELNVTATDDAGNTATQAVTVTITDGNDPPSAPTSLTAAIGTGKVQLTWTSNAEGDMSGGSYEVHRSETSGFAPGAGTLVATVSHTGGGESYTDDGSGNLSAPSSGTTYYYRVIAVDVDGLESGPSSEAGATFPPESFAAQVDRSFGDGDASGSGDYRLVALPGQVDRSIADVVSGESGQTWQAYRDDGSSSDFLVKYDGSDQFRFQSGNGFWLTSRERWQSSLEVPSVSLENGIAEIELRDGWNVISNPLDKDVNWSAVNSENGGALQPIWAFDGTFGQAGTFASAKDGEAYYFLNDQDLNTLQIPYSGAAKSKTKASAKARASAKAEEKIGQVLTLTARRAGDKSGSGSTVEIGLDPEAEQSVGPRDVAAPPARFSAVALRVTAQNVNEQSATADSKRTRSLMEERRPASEMGEGYTFSLRLQRQGEGPVTINAEGAEAFSGRSVVLLDPASGKSHDLQKTRTVEVSASAFGSDGKAPLTVAIGTEGYVKEKARASLPSEITLAAYPNPIREQGTLKYTLPEAGEVSLRVYDILGRRVRTLATGQKEAGRHTVALEASRLSSGVYIARLRAGGTTITRKITVVR
jgi:hypothetical protein